MDVYIVLMDLRYTSQTCPGCGKICKKILEDRWHSCPCGCVLDRDTTLAKIILDLRHKQLSGGTRPTGQSPVEAPHGMSRGTHHLQERC
ncbi:MAG TPA: zinc ribbon domain-containing protein [Ktedonobacteraceae bacterium]|nr:zinc ribbon domain-containing protein [Ktedonobacteraceae bacterium]